VAVKRVEGVQEASFSYDEAAGYVTYDTTVTSLEHIVAELERLTDFSATRRDLENPR